MPTPTSAAAAAAAPKLDAIDMSVQPAATSSERAERRAVGAAPVDEVSRGHACDERGDGEHREDARRPADAAAGRHPAVDEVLDAERLQRPLPQQREGHDGPGHERGARTREARARPRLGAGASAARG